MKATYVVSGLLVGLTLLIGASCSSGERDFSDNPPAGGAGAAAGGDSGTTPHAGQSSDGGSGQAGNRNDGGQAGEPTLSAGDAGAGGGAGGGGIPACEEHADCGECQECVDGLCSAVDPCVTDTECDSETDCTEPPGSASCFTAVCGVGGVCQYVRANEGFACGEPASCVDGLASTAEACDALGICKASSKACGAYACNTPANSCHSQCTTKAQCAPGHECVGKACIVPAANGATCSEGAQCSSGECGCKNASCSQKQCVPTACATCRFDADFNGSCEGFIASGSDDVTNACAEYACNGAGACLKALGSACTSDGECSSAHCECTAAMCAGRACAQIGCAECKFPAGANCLNVSAGYVDRDTCSGAKSCNGSGGCLAKKPWGAACTTNVECYGTCIGGSCTTGSDFGGPCDDIGDCPAGALDCDGGLCD